MTTPTQMSPGEVIECAIGLFDDRSVLPGKIPPALAAAILADLHTHGYYVVSAPQIIQTFAEAVAEQRQRYQR